MTEYPLRKPEVEQYIGTEGIFVFQDGPYDDWDELGCVLFQAGTKRALDVVALHVAYSLDDVKPVLPPFENDALTLTHNGEFAEWMYHYKKPMHVLRGPISTRRITLHREYHLADVLHQAVAHA